MQMQMGSPIVASAALLALVAGCSSAGSPPLPTAAFPPPPNAAPRASARALSNHHSKAEPQSTGAERRLALMRARSNILFALLSALALTGCGSMYTYRWPLSGAAPPNGRPRVYFEGSLPSAGIQELEMVEAVGG